MRIGCIAIVGLLSAFSPPPCQKVNDDFMRDDAGGTDSGADAELDATGEASTTIEMPTSGAVETTAAEATGGDDTGGGDSSEASEGTTEDGPCPQPGEELCGGACVDTTSNRDHCGMCGVKCHPVQQVCEDSMCVPS